MLVQKKNSRSICLKLMGKHTRLSGVIKLVITCTAINESNSIICSPFVSKCSTDVVFSCKTEATFNNRFHNSFVYPSTGKGDVNSC